MFHRSKDLKTADEISNAIIDKIYTTSKCKFNESQLQSFEHMIKFSMSKVIEINKISSAKVGNELILFHLDKVFADKPFQIESNGIRHSLTINECINREGSYIAPFYIGLSIWVFSKLDPRSLEKRLELIKKYKNVIRMNSKAKRIRVEQFELATVQNMERKRNSKRKLENNEEEKLEDGEFDEEALLKDLTDEDFQLLYSDGDARYLKKLQDSYVQARMAPYEKVEYPYFISHVCFPKHLLIEIPVMIDSSLCHLSDEMNGMMNDVYTGSGGFIFKGKMRPFMRTNYSRFSYNMMLNTDGDVENRSAHPTSAMRNSSSTLKCFLHKQNEQKFKNPYLEWEIPYCKDVKLPIHVLFAACGLLDKQKIIDLILLEVKYFFKQQKEINYEKIKEILFYSMNHHKAESQHIQKQEDAWLFIGKLSERVELEEFQSDLIATPDDEKKEIKMSKRKRKVFTLKAIEEAANPDKKEEKEVVALPIYKPYVPKDPNKDLIRNGRRTLCKEILPHVGCDERNDSKFWKTKAMHLARMCAKRLIARVAMSTPNPEKFLVKDNRDGVENRRIQLVSPWVMNQLVKGVITSQIKMAVLEFIAAIHSGNQPEPKNSLDHQRSTNLVMNAFATGIFKSSMMPALIQSQAKAGKKAFQSPDSHRRPNNNNNNKASKDRTGMHFFLHKNM